MAHYNCRSDGVSIPRRVTCRKRLLRYTRPGFRHNSVKWPEGGQEGVSLTGQSRCRQWTRSSGQAGGMWRSLGPWYCALRAWLLVRHVCGQSISVLHRRLLTAILILWACQVIVWSSTVGLRLVGVSRRGSCRRVVYCRCGYVVTVLAIRTSIESRPVTSFWLLRWLSAAAVVVLVCRLSGLQVFFSSNIG